MKDIFSGQGLFIEHEQRQTESSQYCPTPEQIRVECQRIQAEWSEREFWRRAGYDDGKPRWQPPVTQAPSGDY